VTPNHNPERIMDMARGKHFSEHERELIRIGIERGLNSVQIAQAIERTPQGVRRQINVMRAADRMAVTVFGFVADAEAQRVFEGE
jgi:IS30 family transposase